MTDAPRPLSRPVRNSLIFKTDSIVVEESKPNGRMGGTNPVLNVLCVHNNVEPRSQQNSSKSCVTGKNSPLVSVHHHFLRKQCCWRKQVACATPLAVWATSPGASRLLAQLPLALVIYCSLAVGTAGVVDDAGGDVVAVDATVADTQRRSEAGTSAQAPYLTEVPPQVQPDMAELIRKGFEDMRTLMTEGFVGKKFSTGRGERIIGLSDRIDSLDAHMASQDTGLRSLRNEFRIFRGKDPVMDDPEQQVDAPAQD
ncbi:hypothetical protein PIB30_095152 [Stylosanthes scabra]|uniref:Uncharacterized protein n=1 Tax=Stylosanthes scabra TaxID=79078 RepID=A0ABU6VYU7_9FABA|nr:hypothetical protein [Stylosanthes scabra]